MPTLYEFPASGNCYKVRLLASHLGISLKRVPFDIKKGETRTDSFRARFPLGRVPVVELDSGDLLAESNAILWYFGEGTPYVPASSLERARMLQWMFWEQYSHEPFVAVVRAWVAYFGVPAGKEAELAERRGKAQGALETMDKHLFAHPWFSGSRYGLGDIALYAYTHVAHEGGLDVNPFAHLGRWLARVKAQPGHVAIEA